MSLKKNIFGSNAEKKGFNHIKSNWGNFYNIYSQFSFSQLFDDINTLQVTSREKDTLLKMSVDYLICDKDNQPLMCIEFDGLSEGYSKHDKFIDHKKTHAVDINRKLKFDLKLRIAQENELPFYIVSYKEFESLGNTDLSIIDGIIGHTLASKNLCKLFNEYTKEEKKLLTHSGIEDLLAQVELETEKKYNPLSRETTKFYELWENGFIDNKTIKSYEHEDNNYIGLEVTCKSSKGEICQKACMRCIESVNFHPYGILEDICIILVIQKLKPFENLKQIRKKCF